jgi:hypothetical protein
VLHEKRVVFKAQLAQHVARQLLVMSVPVFDEEFEDRPGRAVCEPGDDPGVPCEPPRRGAAEQPAHSHARVWRAWAALLPRFALHVMCQTQQS